MKLQIKYFNNKDETEQIKLEHSTRKTYKNVKAARPRKIRLLYSYILRKQRI